MKFLMSTLIAAVVIGGAVGASAETTRLRPSQRDYSAYFVPRHGPAPTQWQTPSQPYNSSGFAGPSGAAATANTLGY